MTNPEKLLCELIAIPSVNPAFLPLGDPRGGEQSVGEFLAQVATRAGLDVEFHPVLPRRANMLVRLAPSGKPQQRVLLAPHLDTVGIMEPVRDPFLPKRQGRRLHGRGACDTKGSVAAMLAALCEITQSRPRPVHTEFIFAGLVDEESGQAGSRALVASGLKADFALVGEPTRLQVVTAHKGVLWIELETLGKAAHGARPELGRNAVFEMAQIVGRLQTDYAARLRRRKHPLLGQATINVGSIQGGCQPNIVPAECVITIDRRTLPEENDADVKREIRDLLQRHKLSATMRDLQRGACPPLETDPQLPWVRRLLQAMRQKRPAGVDYFSDAGVLARGGIPSVVFGPGDIAQGHTPDEWIEVSQLTRAKDLLVAYFRSLP